MKHPLHLPSLIALARQTLARDDLAEYAALVADLRPVSAADFDLGGAA